MRLPHGRNIRPSSFRKSQVESDLTLDKAKQMISQCEAFKAQQQILKGKEKEETLLHAVDKYALRRKLQPYHYKFWYVQVELDPVKQLKIKSGSFSEEN